MTAEIRIDGACRVHRYQVVTNPGGYVDRIEVSDGGSVTYATCGVWICHQMPWVQAEALLKQQGREVRLVPDGQPWPDLLGTPPAECTLQLADVRGRE